MNVWLWVLVYLAGALLMLALVVYHYSYIYGKDNLLKTVREDARLILVATALWFVLMPTSIVVSIGTYLSAIIRARKESHHGR